VVIFTRMDDFKISNEYDGKTRKLFRCVCTGCGVDIWKPKHQITETNFCSVPCKKIYREKTGKRIEFNCTECGKTFKRFKHHADKVESGRLFCSRECQSLFFTKDKGICINCDKPLLNKQEKYCSTDCQWDYNYKDNIQKWKSGELTGMDAGESILVWLRRYLFDKYKNRCCLCGWCEINPTTGKIPLQVDHIDGNYKNNTEDNLRLLCPNCHSLTPTFGSLNKGNGREKRRLKLQSNKIAA
jgi:hypothetical protein